MGTYIPIERVAEKLNTTPEELHGFERLGWLHIDEKGKHEFLSDHQEYKARFILYLQRVRHCNATQIGTVLSVQNPPYRAAEVDRVLASA